MHHRAGPFEFYDTHFEGFERGFETPRDTVGNVVDNVYLNNVENFAMINGRRHFSLELTITGGVEFGTLASDALAGRTAYNFVMEESESAADIARYNHLVLPYEVILDYDGLDSPQRMYFDVQQSPDHVVWPTSAFDGVTPHRSNSDTPVELRGKTNAELKAIFDDMTDAERTAIAANTAYSVTLVLDATPTINSGVLSGCLNGVEFASGSATQINAHASGDAWGDVNGKTRFHDGTSVNDANYALIGALDHLRVYNRSIDENEIQALFDLRMLG